MHDYKRSVLDYMHRIEELRKDTRRGDYPLGYYIRMDIAKGIPICDLDTLKKIERIHASDHEGKILAEQLLTQLENQYIDSKLTHPRNILNEQ